MEMSVICISEFTVCSFYHSYVQQAFPQDPSHQALCSALEMKVTIVVHKSESGVGLSMNTLPVPEQVRLPAG